MIPGGALESTSLRDLLPQLSAISPNFAGRAIRLFPLSLDFFLNLLLVVVAMPRKKNEAADNRAYGFCIQRIAISEILLKG